MWTTLAPEEITVLMEDCLKICQFRDFVGTTTNKKQKQNKQTKN